MSVFDPRRGGGSRQYTDAQLLEAMREVREASEYAGLSMRVYEDERRPDHPEVRTIVRWLGSWSEATQLLEEGSA